EWQAQYARYIHWSPSYFTAPHPYGNCRRGSWISTDLASVKISFPGSEAVIDISLSHNTILLVSCRCSALNLQEQHYISKLHFSCPQLGCVSDCPARECRTVFMSYRDGIQKFVVRFSAADEARKFIHIVKANFGFGQPIQAFGFDSSGLSSQAEIASSNESAYRPEMNWPSPNAADMSTQLMLPRSEYQSFQHAEEAYQVIVRDEVGKTKTVDPPSFTELLKGCQAEVCE
ncbi:hypothetical protein M569_02923, partial [Genlisea aurea]